MMILCPLRTANSECCLQPVVNVLSSFKDINTPSESEMTSIYASKQKLKDLAPCKERRYIPVWHKRNDCAYGLWWWSMSSDLKRKRSFSIECIRDSQKEVSDHGYLAFENKNYRAKEVLRV